MEQHRGQFNANVGVMCGRRSIAGLQGFGVFPEGPRVCRKLGLGVYEAQGF